MFILGRLGNSSLKRFASQVLALMIIFSVAGFLRSYQVIFENDSHEILIYFEYAIYSITYIAASYKLYKMSDIYGFKVD